MDIRSDRVAKKRTEVIKENLKSFVNTVKTIILYLFLFFFAVVAGYSITTDLFNGTDNPCSTDRWSGETSCAGE
jgi:hypothetical protein